MYQEIFSTSFANFLKDKITEAKIKWEISSEPPMRIIKQIKNLYLQIIIKLKGTRFNGFFIYIRVPKKMEITANTIGRAYSNAYLLKGV